LDGKDAGNYLRDIHAIMERSVKHSTLSGLSGIAAGVLAIAGAALSWDIYSREQSGIWSANVSPDDMFLFIWLDVLLCAVVLDLILTKRKARKIGKSFFDRPMRRVIMAMLPGLVCGLAFTIYFYQYGEVKMIPAYWMLFYGLALLSASTISLRELFVLGAAFVAAGIFTLFAADSSPLVMMGVSFGGFHLVYGIYMWFRYGG
jgi:hypothetical protein